MLEVCLPTYESFVRHQGKTDLPATAHDIRFVWANCGFSGHATVCRFEGPIDNLRAYAIADAKRCAPAAAGEPRTGQDEPTGKPAGPDRLRHPAR